MTQAQTNQAETAAQQRPQWNPKHAWNVVDRAALPKRPAPERVADFREVYRTFDAETARKQATRCIQCPHPVCTVGCPLHPHIPEWLGLVAEGRFLEAAALCQSTSTMPEICSRICPQERLCEGMCLLQSKSEPVSIGALERFVMDYAFDHGAVEPFQATPNGFRIAVVGAGPAGLACADRLSRRGYAVTVFEARHDVGGLLVHGIPAFKLDKAVVERRVELLRCQGVTFRLGTRIGKDIPFGELLKTYDAVFLSIGARESKPMNLPGADLEGVYHALPFLIQKNQDYPHDRPPLCVSGKRVVVLGCGDTAMDCLRVALRCGAREAICLYRRDFENMPASRMEYLNALEEGALFTFHAQPVQLIGDQRGRVSRVRCIETKLGAPGSDGRREPVPVPGTEFEVAADIVVAAFGFKTTPLTTGKDLPPLATGPNGLLVDENMMTSIPGVFAGGDVVRGPSLVGYAIQDALRAADGIEHYVRAKAAKA